MTSLLAIVSKITTPQNSSTSNCQYLAYHYDIHFTANIHYYVVFRRVLDSWPPVFKFGHHVSNHCGLVTKIQTNTQSYTSQLQRILTTLYSCNKAAMVGNMVAKFKDRWPGIQDTTVHEKCRKRKFNQNKLPILAPSKPLSKPLFTSLTIKRGKFNEAFSMQTYMSFWSCGKIFHFSEICAILSFEGYFLISTLFSISLEKSE